jgi:hypothetical protein
MSPLFSVRSNLKHAQALDKSISLTTWSHDMLVYRHMDTAYRFDYKFDILEGRRGRAYALRIFIDLM